MRLSSMKKKCHDSTRKARSFSLRFFRKEAPKNVMQRQEKALEALEARNLLRRLRRVDFASGTSIGLEGRKLISFCANDYLGLAHHPALKAAATQAIGDWGVGAGASRLISGHSRLYEALEAGLAALKGTEAALVFSSGYAANSGALGAIIEKGDLVLADRLNHASLMEACRRSEGHFRIYRHKDIAQLRHLLEKRKKNQVVWIVTDGVFSMDGDCAPLQEILRLADTHEAYIYLDDAHATGVLGPHGGGLADECQLSSPRLIQMGSLSKALGGLGGFVAGSRTLIQYLINKARPFIYSTALPPSILAAGLAALELLEKAPSLREQLWKNRDYFHEKAQALGFDTLGSETPIVPILIGESQKALDFSERLCQAGFFVPAIRPPTVPEGSARLRITFSASHSQVQIEALLKHLEAIARDLQVL